MDTSLVSRLELFHCNYVNHTDNLEALRDVCVSLSLFQDPSEGEDPENSGETPGHLRETVQRGRSLLTRGCVILCNQVT